MTRSPGGLRLFATYALVSLVPMLVLGAAINGMLRHQIDDRALTEAVARAETIADGTIEPILSGGDLAAGLTPTQRADMARVTTALYGNASVLRLRIRSVDGAIVFDPAHPDAPVRPVTDDEVREAASGNAVRLLTHVDADAVDGGATTGVEAVETYVAFHGPGKAAAVGVLETYLPYAPFKAAASDAKRRLSLALTIGLLALWFLLGLVTWSVTRRLRRSARDNDWLAHHDQLTGLPNRLSFAQHLEAPGAPRERRSVAMIDIAGFGTVNDTLGYDNADELLRTISTAIRSALPVDVVVARLAGDQFGILAIDTDLSAFHRMLSAVATAAAARHPIGGIALGADVAIGFATSDDPVADGVGILNAAELAVRAAKESGLSPVRYDPGFDRFDPAKLALAAELGSAIASGQLVLHYQPKLDLTTGAVESAEALVRWQHPDRGLLQPADFVPIAESTSLMKPLTEWVVRQAVSQMAEWRRNGIDIAVSVNVSARSLVDDGLPPLVLGVLEEFSVPACRLEVEVTETAIVADPVRAGLLLEQLHRAGVRLSLDDFGQGATSLLSLARLPLHEIKVDRAFVVGMDDSDDQRAVVDFVISLGHRLGLTVVAEGIETEAAAAALATMGCDQGQGYLFSRPVPAEQFEGWLTHHHHVVSARRRSAGRPESSPITFVDM